MKRFLATASVGVVALASAPSAYAQCVTSANDTVCGGNVTNPLIIVGDGQTVSVDSGSTVIISGNRAIELNGDDNVFTNDGIIDLNGTNGGAVAVRMSSTNGDITFGNAGTITARNNGNGVFLDAANGDIIVNNTGTIRSLSTGSGAALLARAQNGSVTVSNGGSISGQSGFAALVASSQSGPVTVTNTGTVSSNGEAIQAANSSNDALTVTNRGTVSGGFAGISTSSSGATMIQNQGNITGDVYGIFSRVLGGAATGNITNSSTIESGQAAIFLNFTDADTASIINSGSVSTTGLTSIANRNSAIILRGQAAGNNPLVSLINTASGQIETFGSNAHGMLIDIIGASRMVAENAGTITTSGIGASGFVAFGRNTATVDFTNSGQINTSDISSPGVLITGENANVINSGTIATTADFSEAIFILNGGGSSNSSIVNSGTLSGVGDAIIMQGNGGAFSLDSSGTINGDISTSGTTDTVTISGAVNGDISLFDLDDSLTFTDLGASVFGGTLNGGDGNDSLTFAGASGDVFSQEARGFEDVFVTGILELEGARFLNGRNFTIASNGDLTISSVGATIDAPNGFANEGILRLVPDARLEITNGGFTALSGSTTIFGIDAATPQIVADGDINFAAGSQIEIDVLDFNTLVNGRSFDAAVSASSVTDASNVIIDNSMLFDFTSKIINGNILRINIRQTLMIPDAVDPDDLSALGAANGLQSLVDAGDVTLSTLFGQLPDDPAVANGVEQFMPGDSGGIVETANFAIASVSDAVQDRIQYLDRDAKTDGEKRKPAFALWGNALIGDLDGDAMGFAAGFDSSVSGFIAGADVSFDLGSASAIIGGGYYRVDGDVDENTVAPNISDLDTDGGVIYVKIKSGGFGAYLQGTAGGIDINTRRQNSLTMQTVTSVHGGDQTSFTAMAEYMIPVGGWTITPRAEFLQINTDFDGYTEQAALGALRISDQDNSFSRGTFELEAATSFKMGGDVEILPDFRASLMTTNLNSEAITAQFVGGRTPFTVALAEREGTSAGIGAGLSIKTGFGLDFRLSYDGEFSNDLQRHLGLFTAQLHF